MTISINLSQIPARTAGELVSEVNRRLGHLLNFHPLIIDAGVKNGIQHAHRWFRRRVSTTVEGKDSIACGLGYQCKARGKIGNWIVLAERSDEGEIITVKSAKVDGKKIKEMVFYILKDKKFCEA